MNNNYNYKIIGKCPFGTCQLNADGMMRDPSQFRSEKEIDYRNGEEAVAFMSTAEMYGAEPVCKIEIECGVILCYKVISVTAEPSYAFKLNTPDGRVITNPYTYSNTVNPLAIVKCFIDCFKKDAGFMAEADIAISNLSI